MRSIFISTLAILSLALAACQTPASNARETERVETRSETAVQDIKIAEDEFDAALVSGDLSILEMRLADDLLFHHGDAWLEGGDFLFDDTKASLLRVAASGNYVQREILDSAVQVHGDVAVVRGFSKGQLKREGELLSFRTRYIRVYKLQDRNWQMLTHFTTKLYLDDRAPLTEDAS